MCAHLSMKADQGRHSGFFSGYEASIKPKPMKIGVRVRAGHLRSLSQATWAGSCDNSDRNVPKKNCIPNAAGIHVRQHTV